MTGLAMRVGLVVAFLMRATPTFGQEVTVAHTVNLRPEQSTAEPAIRVLTPSEPPMELLEPHPQDGYFFVKTRAGEQGYVWARAVRISVVQEHGVPGSVSVIGCGDGLWKHVYHPTRLLVKDNCVTVSGTIIDDTNGRRVDHARHESDGDTHGWLRVDPQFANLINAGNVASEGGNLVFEIVCHYPVTQVDARASCQDFHDHTVIPPVGAHVQVRGTFVQELNHNKWNEIHPVSSIVILK